MRISTLSWLLVGLQFLLIGYLLATGPLLPRQWYWALPYVAGWLSGLLAFIAFRRSKLTVFPEPRQGATLLTTGIYRYIRHPFYTAVILITLSLAGSSVTASRIAAFLLLALILLIKIAFEEQLLTRQYPEYKAYSQRSWRLIPWIY